MVRVDEDGYLLYRAFHKDCLKREIDLSQYDWLKDGRKQYDKYAYYRKLKEDKDWNTLSDNSEEYAISYLFGMSAPEDNDKVYEYNDLRPLSGSAGYVLIRNGFVYSTHMTWRS